MDEKVRFKEDIMMAINTFLMATEQLKSGFIQLMSRSINNVVQELDKKDAIIKNLQEEVEKLKNPSTN